MKKSKIKGLDGLRKTRIYGVPLIKHGDTVALNPRYFAGDYEEGLCLLKRELGLLNLARATDVGLEACIVFTSKNVHVTVLRLPVLACNLRKDRLVDQARRYLLAGKCGENLSDIDARLLDRALSGRAEMSPSDVLAALYPQLPPICI